MKNYKVLNRLSMLLFISTLTIGCSSTTPKYEPGVGEPNLTLMTGRWKGSITSSNKDIYQSWYDGKLQMNGDKAGQWDILDFKPLNSEGNADTDAYGNKLYITEGNISYATTEYPISNWEQSDSLNFKWKLLGDSYNDDKVGNYRDYVIFERQEDSLSIISGRMIMADSTFEIFFHSKYAQIKK